MTRVRLFLGIVDGVLAIVATVAAARSLITNIQLAHGASALLLPGLLPPVMIGAAAALLGRTAYRNLFWRRYLAGVRRAHATISTAPPNER
jgi:hypothetical protein